MKSKLTSPSTIIDLLERHGFRFSKSLGQNFLIDHNVVNKIIEKSEISQDDNVLEIGPGIGVLTRELAERAKKVVAVEVDETLRPILAETLGDSINAEVHYSDVLKLNLPEFTKEKFGDESFKVIANLPYYITTPILTTILKAGVNVSDVVVMVQSEVADRMVAEVGSKDYSSISVFLKYFGDSKKIITVPNTVFMPKPKVNSAVVRLRVEHKYDDVSLEDLEKVLRAAFQMRRKTILNSLSSGLSMDKEVIREILVELELSENLRAENLTLKNFLELSARINGGSDFVAG